MSAVFRHPDRDAIPVSSAQGLATQAKEVIAWLGFPGNTQRVRGWTLELSIHSPAEEQSKHELPCELMELLTAHAIRLSLRIDTP